MFCHGIIQNLGDVCKAIATFDSEASPQSLLDATRTPFLLIRQPSLRLVAPDQIGLPVPVMPVLLVFQNVPSNATKVPREPLQKSSC